MDPNDWTAKGFDNKAWLKEGLKLAQNKGNKAWLKEGLKLAQNKGEEEEDTEIVLGSINVAISMITLSIANRPAVRIRSQVSYWNIGFKGTVSREKCCCSYCN